jgi:hypothetical protein
MITELAIIPPKLATRSFMVTWDRYGFWLKIRGWEASWNRADGWLWGTSPSTNMP